MPPRGKKSESLGLEASLWESANRLRSSMDAAEYKHVVLGLIFLKYMSDVFASRRATLVDAINDPDSDYYMPTEAARQSILESRDEYTSEGVFWMPENHRWDDLRKAAKQPDIGARIDAAMDAIEKENPSLRGVLPKNYARKELTPATLGGLIDTFSRDDLSAAEHQNMDVLGRVYEYFLGQFASAEGRQGGEFYTPRSVVQLMVEMLEPFNGRVFDPACGSGGMFVQADRFVQAHGGVRNDISVFGQEQNPTTWRLAKMNLALRGIDANLGPQWGDSFADDKHPDLRADYVLANPPFNISEWGGQNLRTDSRWKYGTPPEGNANFAWLQHIAAHLAPSGMAAVVLANSSLSAERTGEIAIRRAMLQADIVDCVVILPPNLFFTTSIPVCIWILAKNKVGTPPHRDRSGEVLVLDARKFGEMASKTHRQFPASDIERLASIYKAWRSQADGSLDVPGIARAVTVSEILENGGNLSPNFYITPSLNAPAPGETTSALKEALRRASARVEERRALAREVSIGFSAIGMTAYANMDWSGLELGPLLDIQNLLFDDFFVHFSHARSGLKETGHRDVTHLPEGWKIRQLVDVAHVIDCLHSTKPARVPASTSSRILLEVSNIRDDGLLNLSSPYNIDERDYGLWTRNLELRMGDCVVTNTGRVGAVARIPQGLQCAIGRNITGVRPRNPVDAVYIFRYLKSMYMARETYRKTDIGTILDSLNVKGIKKLTIIWPDEESRRAYEGFAEPLQRLIETQIGHERFEADPPISEQS